MSHYREINRELVDEVRKMRKEIKLCHDEIIHLKGELLEKHESEVFLRKQCYNWAVKNFLQLIQTMEPDSDILPVLKENIQAQERLSSTEEGVPWRLRASSERESGTRRSYSMLSREVQRSHSLINSRKSLRSTSPIRRKSNEANEEIVEQNSHFEQATEDVGLPQNELIETESLSQPLINLHMDHIIYEHSDEEDLDVESIYESIEEVVDTSPIRSTFRDMTNILTTTMNSSKKENSLIKILQKKTKKLNLNDQENSTSQELVSHSYVEEKTITNTISRLTDNSVSNIEKCTLQELRTFTNNGELSETSKSFPIKQSNNTHNEVSINSPTPSYVDMTLSTFKNVYCSTPNSNQNSLLNDKTPTKKKKSDTDAKIENTAVRRPSRQCKPTNLAEAKLGVKLRNEVTPKPKRKNRSKSKGKK